jgi:hypothetical protein
MFGLPSLNPLSSKPAGVGEGDGAGADAGTVGMQAQPPGRRSSPRDGRVGRDRVWAWMIDALAKNLLRSNPIFLKAKL